ncbi:HAMP domain-containing sensor histidine kinase [uncultured Pseudoteredinibacter sp.]|uniref:sensor histidine kinase n=1 Tax=uncultured Pseudoteredinibacter sp. TaxID=1641701 RepID=UPI0026238C93|nr:HAMP domain-containing sensor histidine kinase [uncultured Pseudoteredinibacter sp.]
MSTESDSQLLTRLNIAEQKAEELARLLATVGHEVKTPIGIAVTASSHLQLKVENIKSEYQSGKMTQESLEAFFDLVSESAKILQSNTQRASALMDSFKQVAIDQAQETVRVIELAPYFKQLQMSFALVLKQAEAELSFDCDDSLRLQSCPGALTQVLSNLIMNAIQHARIPGTPLVINLRAIAVNPERGELSIELRDNGRGMSEDLQQQVFEQYFTTAKERGGSGLGLGIVRELMNSTLHGELTLSSEEGRGSCFSLLLPSLPLGDN